MKFITLFLLALTSVSAFAGWQNEARSVLAEYNNECNSAQIVIDEVVKNDHISGHVVGLPTEALSKFKVVFFVKSNRWYVHPYSTGGAGYQYATLDSTGAFTIPTVLRTPSKSLAAILFPMQVEKASQSFFFKPFLGIFGGLTKYNCTWTTFAGNGDFFL